MPVTEYKICSSFKKLQSLPFWRGSQGDSAGAQNVHCISPLAREGMHNCTYLSKCAEDKQKLEVSTW